jgi:iron complex outermembrane receptor protein
MTNACEPGRRLLRRTIAELLRPRVSAPLFVTTLALGAISPARAVDVPADTIVLANQDAARPAATGDGSFQLDLPAQDLNVALQALATASHHRLFYKADLVRGKKSAALRGKYTTTQALESLLSGTELTFEITTTGVVLIRGPSEAAVEDVVAREGQVPVAGAGWVEAANGSPIRLARASDAGRHSQGAAGSEEVAPTEAAPLSVELTEVVVTSQLRRQAAKDVPISMTVVGKEELESLRVRRFEDFIDHVPNVTYVSAGHFGPDGVALRGISVAVGGRYDPISVTVDGAGFGAQNAGTVLNTQYLDVERIEVLRGPQGTLTGRSAVGGSINIITAQPDTEALAFKGVLDIGRFGTQHVKLVGNLPLSDTFALRASAFAETSDGAVKNLGPGGGNSGYDNRGGRLAARWRPADGLTLDASFAKERLDLGMESALPRDVWSDDARRAERLAELALWGGEYEGAVSFFRDVGANGGHVRNDVEQGALIEDSIASFHAAYEFSNLTLDLFYGNFRYKPAFELEWDQTEYNYLKIEQDIRVDSDTAELRLTSRWDGAFNWVAGASWLDESTIFHTINRRGIGADGVNPVSDMGAVPYNAPVVGGDYMAVPEFDGRDYHQITSYGLFANIFWDLSERLHLSAGGRFSKEDNSYGYANNFSPIGDDLEGSVDDFSPRIALNLDLNDDVTTYVQYATGFRSGYANNHRAVALGLAPPVVKSEHAKNYEIGIKGQALDRRVAVAAALFYLDYTDMQTFQFAANDEGEFGYFDINSSSATAKGFEVETMFRPLDSLELRANVGYVDSSVDEVNFYGELLEDAAFPFVRPWTVAVAGTYTRQLTDELKGQVRADYTSGSSAFGGFGPRSFWDIPSFENVDLSAGVSADRWSVTAYMKNVLDEQYWTGTVGGSWSTRRGGLGMFVPRTYGLRFTYDLGGP